MAMLPPDPTYIFKGEMLSVCCVVFKITKSFQRIYAGSQSGSVHVWDLKTKREVAQFKACESPCLSVCTPHCGNFNQVEILITGSKSGEVSFWKEQGNKWIREKLLKIDFFGFCKCQAFSDILYAPIKDAKCELISVEKMEKLETVSLEGDNWGDIMAFKVCHINSRKSVIVAYEGHKLALWDLEECKMLSRLQLDECPMAVDYDAASNRGAWGGPGDKIMVFSLDKNFQLKPDRSITLTNAGVASIRIRPDGKLVAVGCWDGRLRLYSWKSLVLLAALDVHSSTVQDVSFGENYEENFKVKYLLAAGSQDSRISLWDLYN